MTQVPPDADESTPIETGRLLLDQDQPLVAALASAFRTVLGYAGEMTDLVAEDPTTAVHEYRKAIRRGRSVLRMLRPALPKASRRALRDELRALARATSILRDADVLIDTCASLVLEGPAAATLAHVGEQVAAHRTVLLDAGRAAFLLTDGARRLAMLPDVLDSVVALDTSAEALATAFERAWYRAWAARKLALKERTDEATHSWRKRVKEVRYQLELLAEPTGGSVEGLRQVSASLAKRLGDITDLIALRRYLAVHTDGLSRDERETLDAELHRLIDRERRAAADPIVEVRARIAKLAVPKPAEEPVEAPAEGEG